MRSCLLLLCALFPALAARAQYEPFFSDHGDRITRTFYGGLAIGTNFSQVDGDGFAGYNKVGLNVGPLVYVRFSELFTASMELLYTQKGSRFREQQQTSSGVPYLNAYDLKLNYVEVPLLLHMNLGRIQCGGGLAYARLIHSSEEAYTTNPVNLYPDVYTFRKDDFSGLAEASYELYKGAFLQLRYSYSLKTIRDANRIPEGYGGGRFGRQVNNMFSLRVVVLIR